MVHTWTVGRCIVYTRIRLLLLIHPFISSFFFLSNFQTLNFFVTLLSGTVRKVEMGQWVDVSCIPESCYCPYSSLCNFVTLFSGTVRPRRLKLGTHMDNGGMYCVY